MSIEFPDQLHQAYREAVQKAGRINRYYDIAGRILRLGFAGSSLIPHLAPAFEHLATEPHHDPSLSVLLWDGASTGVNVTSFPWKDDPEVEDFRNPPERPLVNPVVYFKDEDFQGVYYSKSGILNILDKKNGRAFFWTPDPGRLFYFEMSAPLLIILQWWLRGFGYQVVHAGAVGFAGGGILLAGKGGSGKSCTVMACLESEMSSTGDDFVLVDPSSPPKVHSLYNSSKLHLSDLIRFPSLAKASPAGKPANEDKALIFMHTIYPGKIAREMPVRAIVFPRVDPKAETALKPLSPADSLKYLAPSSIYILRGSGQDDLRRMAELVTLVPGYVLQLGRDSNRAPELISNLLKNIAEGNRNPDRK